MLCIRAQMGSIDDNGSGGCYAYRMSKAALNIGEGAGEASCQEGRWVLGPGSVRLCCTLLAMELGSVWGLVLLAGSHAACA